MSSLRLGVAQGGLDRRVVSLVPVSQPDSSAGTMTLLVLDIGASVATLPTHDMIHGSAVQPSTMLDRLDAAMLVAR
jgi:hypothetical protein